MRNSNLNTYDQVRCWKLSALYRRHKFQWIVISLSTLAIVSTSALVQARTLRVVIDDKTGNVVQGHVELSGLVPFLNYCIQLKAYPSDSLDSVTTTAGDHPLDSESGLDVSDAGRGVVGRLLIPIDDAACSNDPAVLFRFTCTLSQEPVLLDFITGNTFGVTTDDFETFPLEPSYFTLIPAKIGEGEFPTLSPTPTRTPTFTWLPTQTRAATRTRTPTCTQTPPVPTLTSSPTPTECWCGATVISGLVRDKFTMNPIVGALVQGRLEFEEGPQEYSDTTDDAGRYTLSVEADDGLLCTVSVAANGYQSEKVESEFTGCPPVLGFSGDFLLVPIVTYTPTSTATETPFTPTDTPTETVVCTPANLHAVRRSMPDTCQPGVPYSVEILISGDDCDGEYDFYLEETVPSGWIVVSPEYESRNGDTIRWRGEISSYTIMAPTDTVTARYYFEGSAWANCTHTCWVNDYVDLSGDISILCQLPATPTATPTITPTHTPTPIIGLIAVDGFGGLHAAGRGKIAPWVSPLAYTWPLHTIRDANMTGDRRGLYVVDLFGHVSIQRFDYEYLEQIPAELQYYFVPQDIVVAVRPAGNGHDGAYILLDNGRILSVGDAPLISNVYPPLPYRDGTDENPSGDPMDREMAVPGPLQGPLNIGTISNEGGWNPKSAIDFALTDSGNALVLSRSGKVTFVRGSASGGSSSGKFEIAPYFGIDIARRIEHLKAGDAEYYIVLDGLGGVHLAGPAESELRTNWNNKVLTELAYFGAVIGEENGSPVYAGLDAANDFVYLLLGEDDIGIIMLDGLGGLHFANLGPEYTSIRTPYFGHLPQATLDWMVSLILVK